MAGLKAGKTFNDRITVYLKLSDHAIDELLGFAFLPPEVEASWEGEPTLEAVREYLVLWWRELARYADEWRNAYNAAKHGLAIGVRPVQLAFLNADRSGPPVDFMNGPVMRTLEYDPLVDAKGRKVKDPATGQQALKWFWMYRAIDPAELVAQTIVTADLLELAASHRGGAASGPDWHPGSCPRRTEAVDPQEAHHNGHVIPDRPRGCATTSRGSSRGHRQDPERGGRP